MKPLTTALVTLISLVTLHACSSGNDDDEQENGIWTITVTMSGTDEFEGHRVFYAVMDSDSKDPNTGAPSGKVLGDGSFVVTDGAGSCTTVAMGDSPDSEPKLFAPGTYYISGMVDMNDNAAETSFQFDSGDRLCAFVEFSVEGDTTQELTTGDFPHVVQYYIQKKKIFLLRSGI